MRRGKLQKNAHYRCDLRSLIAAGEHRPTPRSPPAEMYQSPFSHPMSARPGWLLVMRADGSGRRVLAEQIAGEPDTWIQFAGWSPDGKLLLYGSKRDGVRQLFVMNLADLSERQLTDLKPGHAAMWYICNSCGLFRLMNTRMKKTEIRRTPMTRCRLASGLLVVLGRGISRSATPACGAVMKTIYVSPAGDDANPDTQERPLATIGGARDAVRRVNRNMTGDIVVVLAGGRVFDRRADRFRPSRLGHRRPQDRLSRC